MTDTSSEVKKQGGMPGRTAERIQRIKQLIEALRINAMSRDDIGELLGFSPSGVRKYIVDLREAHVLDVGHEPGAVAGKTMYMLVQDEAIIATYVQSLDVERSQGGRRSAPSPLAIAQRDSTRHFHLMQDDTEYSVRVRKAPAAPDPLALPRNFFGPSHIEDEPIKRDPVTSAAPARFPAPASFRFDLGVPA